MTGVHRPHRASSNPHAGPRRAVRLRRAGRAPLALLAAPFLVAPLLGALACQSELTDGMATLDPNTVPNFGGTAGSSGVPSPGGPNGIEGPGEGVIPGQVTNSQADRNPTLGGVTETTVDATGAPLPVDQLPALEQCATPGPRLIRRLTAQQYRNTLVSVFGGTDVPDAPTLRDATTLGYSVDVDDSLIEGLDAAALMNLAEDIGEWAVANRLGQLTNNCLNLNDQNCRQQFIRNLGARISREPLDQERVDRYNALFNGVGTFQDGVFGVVAAMVQSPYMLYRRELGPLDRNQGGEYTLTQFEVASELSYFLNDGPPDDTLRQAAEQGRLGTVADIDREVARLLDTAAADDVFSRFVKEWLDIDGLQDKAKTGDELTPDVRNAMLAETESLFLDVFSRGGSIGELFSANYTFLNQALTSFYRITGATSANLEQVDISDGRRLPGLLGHGAFLSEHALSDNSSPVQRAFIVRERLLCNDLPEVPLNLDTNLDAPVATDTSRERYARHSAEEPCRSCHRLMDPIGFTFEHYDGFGRYRETEAGKPVDDTGAMPVMRGREFTNVSFPLDGAEDLAAYLAEIEEVRACLISNLSYFGYGMANANKWSNQTKVCTDNFIRQEARTAGNTLQSVVSAIAHAPHFTRRVRDVD